MQIETSGSSLALAAFTGQPGVQPSESVAVGTPKDKTAKSGDSKSTGDRLELSPDAQREVEALKAQDQQVRAHEAAHMAAGGGLVRGGASYSYKQGPDGKRYAAGGEVSIDTSPVPDNPKATEMKARQIQAAALAPADPSPQDRKVASQAAQMAAKAATESAQQAGKNGTGRSLNIVA